MSSLNGVTGGGLFGDQMGWPDQRDIFQEVGPYGFADGSTAGLTKRDNRLTGEILPTAINWFQLKIIRDRCRMIARNNEYAIAAMGARRSYVVGTGFKYQVVPKKAGTVPDQFLDSMQEFLDLWVEHNNLSEVENEAVYRLDAEGEFFVRKFFGNDGMLRTRFIEPELIRSPVDSSDSPQDTFGIRTSPEDIRDVVGYWVIEKPWENTTGVLVPADEIIHVKINSESNSKRGLPTLYAVESNLRAAEDVLASMIALAKTRAKIGMIRSVADAPAAAIEELERSAADGQVTDRVTGRSTNVERFAYGTILTSSDNIKYEFPSLNAGASDLIEILKVNLRAIAARFGISEIMMSADASNANYASSLTAEAPATKSFERFQSMLTGAFGTRKTRPGRSLAWEALAHAARMGHFDAKLLGMVTIQVNPPTVQARDRAAESNVHKTYLDMGVLSKASISSDIGVDPKKESEQILREQKEAQKNQPTPPGGMGAIPGQQPGGQPPQGEVDDSTNQGGQTQQPESEAPPRAPGPNG